ncbi:hypothetical protein ABTY98_03855 [Streptomyces sp. NPDC096040]|uniref:hypothetical protein n=1 Tax=Streptomyces sp. NPDC096040 TaxID=3155541 RepID=UPI003332F20C
MTAIGMVGRAVATAALLAGASFAVPTAASAAEVHPDNCGTGHFWDVDSVGPRYYQSSGGTVGAYNSSSQTSTLKYTLSITKSRTSGWTSGGGLSVKVAVAEINGNTNYTVSKSNTTGISVEHNLSVPGKRYGYITPKVEFQKFHIEKAHYGANCKTVVDKDYGVFRAVTAKIFYSTCVGKTQCTTKP